MITSIYSYTVLQFCSQTKVVAYLSSFSVAPENPWENTRSGIRQPAGELDTKSGNSSRTIILTVFGSKVWRLLPTSTALSKKIKHKVYESTVKHSIRREICEMEFYNLQFYNNFTSTLLHRTVFRPPPFHSGARRA